jgi:probable F420-dependent oxidoreductase
MMQRLGLTVPFDPFQNRHIVDLVRTADRCGYTDAWSFESFGSDAFSPLAATAMLSERMRLGTAIVPVYTRPAALIAMSAATVNQLSGGRLVLGLGISTPNIVENWMGVPFEKPHTRVRETVAAIRAIMKGEKVTAAGKVVRINGFRMEMNLDMPPAPIYLGAQGAKMLRLAGEIGDGVIVNFVTTDTLPAMLEHTREGMRATGKDPSKLDVVCRIICAVGEDEATTRALFRRSLTAYLTVPQYNKFFRQIGYENEAGVAMELWNKGERKQALESVPEEMVEAIFVFGDAKKCRRRIDEYFRAGVTTTALQFSSFAPTPEERRARVLKAMEQVASA